MICVYFVNVMERAIINKLRRHRPDKLGNWSLVDPGSNSKPCIREVGATHGCIDAI